MVLRVTLFLFSCSLIHAEVVPNRFIIELSTEPVASHIYNAGSRSNLLSTEALSHRDRIAREQTRARAALQQNGAQVLDQVDTVANALLVQVTPENPEPWANLAGVLKVTPVHTVSLLLDRVVAVNKIIDAWAQIGGPSNAGLGMKIGIIDTGVDVTHPGFQNSLLSLPANFPLVNKTSDTAFTNNKVIVARSYVSLLGSFDPDTSARDRMGHGTALAMIAAGGTVAAPLATITGVSPGAWVGSYKVFGSPNYNDSASDDAILKALDDAVKDGMDVVSLSFGVDFASRLGDDVDVQAVERATQAGVLVVAAAGNNGSTPFTISSPATAPDSIAVGAQANDRIFSASVQVSGLNPLLATPGDGPAPSAPVSGPVADVATLDGNGLACNALPSGSLSNRIALILRGTCTFAVKLNNAAAAGASAAIVYTSETSPVVQMFTDSATLPAEMISNADGLLLKQSLAAGTASVASVVFTLSPVNNNPAQLAYFSATGPSVDLSIKPDLVAVGTDFYTATQTYDTTGEMYSPDRYIVVDGTSFSTPTVAGAAALLKAARPGLTAAQYRSLLINSASSLNLGVQQVGAGSLNSGASLLATAAAFPTSLSFGAGGAFPEGTLNLQLTNTGAASDTFTLTAAPAGARPAPALSASSLQLEPGASGTISVTLSGSNLAPGGYEGYVVISGANAKAETRVPYWYGVTSDTPVHITDIDSDTDDPRGQNASDAITFRITDAAGVPITSVAPVTTVISGGGTVRRTTSYDSDVPGLFAVSVKLGATAGPNVFRVTAGPVSADFVIVGN